MQKSHAQGIVGALIAYGGGRSVALLVLDVAVKAGSACLPCRREVFFDHEAVAARKTQQVKANLGVTSGHERARNEILS